MQRKIGILLIIISWCVNIFSQDTLFVAKNGNNIWSGKLSEPNIAGNDGPFCTIEKARDAIREMKESKNFSGPITVMIKGGTYFLDNTIVFGPQDSGTKGFPITYMAYPGEKPVISGGKRIESSWNIHNDEIIDTNEILNCPI